MKKFALILGLSIFASGARAGSIADGVNRERVNMMKSILESSEGQKIIENYGAKGFVFDGMNWVNSFNVDLRYYNLRFKKFDMEVLEKNGAKTFIMITKTCDHAVTLRNGTIVGAKPVKCEDEKAPVFKSEGH